MQIKDLIIEKMVDTQDKINFVRKNKFGWSRSYLNELYQERKELVKLLKGNK